jgi:hypothetical protein
MRRVDRNGVFATDGDSVIVMRVMREMECGE